MNLTDFSIRSSRPIISVQDIVRFIDKGEQFKTSLVEVEDKIEYDTLTKYLNGIILTPDYQRQYRSTITEESSIIESLLVGIPIPEIFLVRTQDKLQLRHVMDGQHRLTAIYRYVKGKFPLKNLEILDKDSEGRRVNDPQFEGKKFFELDLNIQIKILGSFLSVLEFNAFENSDIEIELFKRYNKNTKPLEAHEISMATYFSKTSQLISQFIKEIFSLDNDDNSYFKYSLSEANNLNKAYNITPNRKDKQKNHQEICIILNILTRLPEIEKLNLKDGVKLATDFLKYCSELYNSGEENYKIMVSNFNDFNNFVLKLSESVEYPISMQLMGKSLGKGMKYHTGISIILALIYNLFDIDLESDSLIQDVQTIIEKSPLGDSEYRASSTNLRQVLVYLLGKNKIHESEFNSLKLKKDNFSKINLSSYSQET